MVEKTAATHRYEMFDQFAETSRLLAQAAEQAMPNSDLAANAKAVAASATEVGASLGGRPNDSLFQRTAYEIKSGKATNEPTPLTADNTAQEIISQQLKHPMKSIAKTSERLQDELKKFTPDELKQFSELTAYRKQATLPDMNLAHDDNLIGSLKRSPNNRKACAACSKKLPRAAKRRNSRKLKPRPPLLEHGRPPMTTA